MTNISRGVNVPFRSKSQSCRVCKIRIGPSQEDFTSHLKASYHLEKIQADKDNLYKQIDDELLNIQKPKEWKPNSSDSYSFASFSDSDFRPLDLPQFEEKKAPECYAGYRNIVNQMLELNDEVKKDVAELKQIIKEKKIDLD